MYKDRIIELVGEHEDVSFLKPGAKLPRDKKRVAFKVDADMVENVGLAYDYVSGILAGEPSSKVFLEGRTNPLPDRDDTSGTADVTVDGWPALLHVIDYKNGRVLVEHEDNEQLMSYLLGRAHDFGWDYDLYKITIVQPNAFHPEGRIRTHTVTAEELRAFEAKHRAAVERVDEAIFNYETFVTDDETFAEWASGYLKAGPHCLMCNAMAICPAYRQMLADEAKLDFADDPTENLKFSITDPERARAVLRWAPYMSALIRACNAYIMATMMAGRPVDGLKLVRGKSHRRWRDDLSPDQIAKKMVEKGYLNGNEVAQLWTEPELIPGTKAEKLLSNDKRKEFNNEFLVKPTAALKVVPEDDHREAVTVDPASDFAEEIEEYNDE
jgi:hypothetical protein